MTYILVVGNGLPTQEEPKQGAFAFDQARGLADLGYSVVYAALDIRSLRHPRPWGIQRLDRAGLPIFRMNIPIGRAPLRIKQALSSWALARLYQKIESTFGPATLLHAHFLEAGEPAAALCQKKGLPFFYTEHASQLHQSPLPPALKKRAQALYPQTQGLIAVSRSLAENLQKETGFAARVIPNMVDTALFHYDPVPARDKGHFTFVFAGNLRPIKGVDILLRAFQLHHDRFPEDQLRLFGDGPLRSDLTHLAEELGIFHQVHFEGMRTRKEIAEAYRRSQVFCLLSRSETFGLAYIEALAAGLPVLASDCGGPADFMRPDYGLVVPVGDIQAAGRALSDLRSAYSNYQPLHIAQAIRQAFSPKAVMGQVLALYQERLPEQFCTQEAAQKRGGGQRGPARAKSE